MRLQKDFRHRLDNPHLVHPASAWVPPQPKRLRPARRRAGRTWILAGALLAVAFGAGAIVVAIDLPLPSSSPAAALAKNAEEQAAIMLARSTLLTLHDANRTGNYAVLRGLAAPAFQAENSTEQLTAIFSGLRQGGVDLSTAALQDPLWTSPPMVGDDRLLRLRGRYAIPRYALDFQLAFADIGGHWRLFDVTVAALPDKPVRPAASLPP